MTGSVDWFMYRKAAKDPSACIMLLPDETGRMKINQLKRMLALPEGAELTPDDGTEGPHITIRYWKTDGAPLDAEVFDYLSDRLDGQSLNVVANDWDIFGKPGEEDTLVMLIHSPELMALQEELDEWLQERGVPASTYGEYKSHISVAEGVTEVPKRKPNLKLKMGNWSVSEGKGGDAGYEEVWSLRAACWINLSFLNVSYLIAQLRDPEKADEIRRNLQAVLDLATAYVRAKSNLAASMRDERTVGTMRMFEKDISDARLLVEDAMYSGTTTPDLDAKLALVLDLAQQAMRDETIKLPTDVDPGRLRDNVSDFYDLILHTPRSAKLVASRKLGNSITRFATRHETTPATPESPGSS